MKRVQVTLEQAKELLDKNAPGRVCADSDGLFYFYPGEHKSCPCNQSKKATNERTSQAHKE